VLERLYVLEPTGEGLINKNTIEPYIGDWIRVREIVEIGIG